SFDKKLRAVRDEEVAARAELDHPDALSAREPVPDARVEDDPPRQGPGDLLERDHPAWRGQRDAILLVIERGLLVEGRHLAAARVAVLLDAAGDGSAVDVAVEDGHEDRDA